MNEDKFFLQPSNNSLSLKDVEAHDNTSSISSPRASQELQEEFESVSSKTHCAIDSMSNIACIPPQVARELNMKIEQPNEVLLFGSYSHDGSITVKQLATDMNSRYLPKFAVTMSGKMAILPSSWLSKMGYEFRIHSFEKGFSIINGSNGTKVYESEPHTDKFHYVTWQFLQSLQPTSMNQINYHEKVQKDNAMTYERYIQEVQRHLDTINDSSSQSRSTHACNATRKEHRTIPQSIVRAIREAHTRYGHQTPRQMAETLSKQARSDMTSYTAEDVTTHRNGKMAMHILQSSSTETWKCKHRNRRQAVDSRSRVEHGFQDGIHTIISLGI